MWGDPRNDRLPRSWIAARCSLPPSRYRFPISSILPSPFSTSFLPPPSLPPASCARARVYACIERTRIPRCLFLSTRMPFYDVPSLGHRLRSLPLLLLLPPFLHGRLLFPGVRPPTRDKISRITRIGNYPLRWSDRFPLFELVQTLFPLRTVVIGGATGDKSITDRERI